MMCHGDAPAWRFGHVSGGGNETVRLSGHICHSFPATRRREAAIGACHRDKGMSRHLAVTAATAAVSVAPSGASSVAAANGSPRVSPWLTMTTGMPSFAA